MYCGGEYPTPNSNLHLNQINYLISNYQNVRIGWSTHEEPNNYELKLQFLKVLQFSLPNIRSRRC